MDQPSILPGAQCICAERSMQHSCTICEHIRICAVVLLEYGEIAGCAVCLYRRWSVSRLFLYLQVQISSCLIMVTAYILLYLYGSLWTFSSSSMCRQSHAAFSPATSASSDDTHSVKRYHAWLGVQQHLPCACMNRTSMYCNSYGQAALSIVLQIFMLFLALAYGCQQRHRAHPLAPIDLSDATTFGQVVVDGGLHKLWPCLIPWLAFEATMGYAWLHHLSGRPTLKIPKP